MDQNMNEINQNTQPQAEESLPGFDTNEHVRPAGMVGPTQTAVPVPDPDEVARKVYAQQQAMNQPYAQPVQQNPYAAPQSNPYAAPQSNPYAAPQPVQQNVYAQPAAQPQASPYTQTTPQPIQQNVYPQATPQPTPQNNSYVKVEPKAPTVAFPTAALVFGILSIALSESGIISIIFAVISLSQQRKFTQEHPDVRDGKKIAARITSIIGLSLAVLCCLAYLALIIFLIMFFEELI